MYAGKVCFRVVTAVTVHIEWLQWIGSGVGGCGGVEVVEYNTVILSTVRL